ncbi:MAG TPA: hypothetical protein VF092_28840 [Longimicrobium sp.]
MRKLALNPNELVVQSFPTLEAESKRGTVHGMDVTNQDTCNGPGTTCAPGCTRVDTCVSCPNTCVNTCASCPVSCNPADCPSSDGRC